MNKLARKSELADSTLINQVYLCCTRREAVTIDDIVSAKGDLIALLTSSDTDVFSKRRELTKNKRLHQRKGCAEQPVERYCDLVQVRCIASDSGNAVY